jgi:hypothetical protein
MTDAPAITVPPASQVHARTSPGAGFWASAAAVALRTVRKFVRTPQLIVMTTIQSALWLLIFRYIFGGAIDVDGLSYVAFLVPGVVVTNTLFSGMGAAPGWPRTSSRASSTGSAPCRSRASPWWPDAVSPTRPC